MILSKSGYNRIKCAFCTAIAWRLSKKALVCYKCHYNDNCPKWLKNETEQLIQGIYTLQYMNQKEAEIIARREFKATMSNANSMDQKSAKSHPEWVEEIIASKIKQIMESVAQC